jgi:nicotinamidase/pyrazinamidase
MKVLLLVDLQNDFLTGGAVPVPQGEAIIPIANQLEGCFKLVVATQDWHPPNHKSFAPNHTGKQPGEVVVLKKRPQRLWPTHCVQSTRGSELASSLMLNRVNKIQRKGTDAEIDGYSAFFDEGQTHGTGLYEYLKDRKVKEVYVLGLGINHCVKATALDAVSLGFKTFLIEDACRPFNFAPDETLTATEEMRKAGVSVIRSQELLQIPKAN